MNIIWNCFHCLLRAKQVPTPLTFLQEEKLWQHGQFWNGGVKAIFLKKKIKIKIKWEQNEPSSMWLISRGDAYAYSHHRHTASPGDGYQPVASFHHPSDLRAVHMFVYFSLSWGIHTMVVTPLHQSTGLAISSYSACHWREWVQVPVEGNSTPVQSVAIKSCAIPFTKNSLSFYLRAWTPEKKTVYRSCLKPYSEILIVFVIQTFLHVKFCSRHQIGDWTHCVWIIDNDWDY